MTDAQVVDIDEQIARLEAKKQARLAESRQDALTHDLCRQRPYYLRTKLLI